MQLNSRAINSRVECRNTCVLLNAKDIPRLFTRAMWDYETHLPMCIAGLLEDLQYSMTIEDTRYHAKHVLHKTVLLPKHRLRINFACNLSAIEHAEDHSFTLF